MELQPIFIANIATEIAARYSIPQEHAIEIINHVATSIITDLTGSRPQQLAPPDATQVAAAVIDDLTRELHDLTVEQLTTAKLHSITSRLISLSAAADAARDQSDTTNNAANNPSITLANLASAALAATYSPEPDPEILTTLSEGLKSLDPAAFATERPQPAPSDD